MSKRIKKGYLTPHGEELRLVGKMTHRYCPNFFGSGDGFAGLHSNARTDAGASYELLIYETPAGKPSQKYLVKEIVGNEWRYNKKGETK